MASEQPATRLRSPWRFQIPYFFRFVVTLPIDARSCAGPSLVVTLPIDVPGATAMPEAAEEEEEDYMPSSSKRHRTSSHGSMFGNNEFVGSPMGSPVSTLDMGAQFLPVAAPKGGARHAKAALLKENKEGRDGSTGGSLSRKNKPQRCSICKECGHKSRTCRFAQTAGARVRPTPTIPQACARRH